VHDPETFPRNEAYRHANAKWQDFRERRKVGAGIMRRWEPQTAGRVLMQRLTEHGLPGYTYTDDAGSSCVHAGPPAIHDAGIEITVVPVRGACAYISEWGNTIGDTHHLDVVVTHILWLFGRAERTRP